MCEGEEIRIIPRKGSLRNLKGIVKKDVGITSAELDKIIKASSTMSTESMSDHPNIATNAFPSSVRYMLKFLPFLSVTTSPSSSSPLRW